MSYNKGMFITIDDNKCPNLMIEYGDSLSSYDINFTNHIGMPKYEMFYSSNTCDFENMSKDEFISKFGKVLDEFKKNPEGLYYNYKTFAIEQLLFFDVCSKTTMPKDKFIEKYENYYNELREYFDRKNDKSIDIEITAGYAYDGLVKK
jgi:hypothetical protein